MPGAEDNPWPFDGRQTANADELMDGQHDPEQSKRSTQRAPGAARDAAYVLEDQVGFLLRCAHQRATEVFNAVMGGFGVTPTQFAALAKLDDLGSVSQNQLGRLTAMDPATISGVSAG